MRTIPLGIARAAACLGQDAIPLSSNVQGAIPEDDARPSRHLPAARGRCNEVQIRATVNEGLLQKLTDPLAIGYK